MISANKTFVRQSYASKRSCKVKTSFAKKISDPNILMIFLFNGVVFFLQKPCNSSNAPQVSGLSKVLCFFLFLGAVAQWQGKIKF